MKSRPSALSEPIPEPRIQTQSTSLNSKPVTEHQLAPVTIGWREWMSLPQLNIPIIKIKADTGARTSCLHALDITPFEKDGKEFVSFNVAPLQRNDELVLRCTAPVIDQRVIRNSGGQTQLRYVVQTLLRYGDTERVIDLTLNARTNMKYRMLLGRTSLSPNLIVDSNTSYQLGRTEARQHYPNLLENGA